MNSIRPESKIEKWDRGGSWSAWDNKCFNPFESSTWGLGKGISWPASRKKVNIIDVLALVTNASWDILILFMMGRQQLQKGNKESIIFGSNQSIFYRSRRWRERIMTIASCLDPATKETHQTTRKASLEGKELVPFAIESALGLSVLTLWVAGSAVDSLFHVTAVGLISIVQIAISGFRKCFKISCYRMHCRTSRKRSGLIPSFGGSWYCGSFNALASLNRNSIEYLNFLQLLLSYRNIK